MVDEAGTISDRDGLALKVRFDLTRRQEFSDGIAGMKSADGAIRFENGANAYPMYDSGNRLLLQGGCIQAYVLLITVDAFKVTGPITETG